MFCLVAIRSTRRLQARSFELFLQLLYLKHRIGYCAVRIYEKSGMAEFLKQIWLILYALCDKVRDIMYQKGCVILFKGIVAHILLNYI